MTLESNPHRGLTSILLQSTILEWVTTLGLIFGGCCSNAWALEILTSQNPQAGSLVTFAQFLFVSLYGLRKQLTILPDSDVQDILDRKRLLDNLANDLIGLHSLNQRGIPVSVTVDGPTTISQSFADELETEMKRRSPFLSVKRINTRDAAAGVTLEFGHPDDLDSFDPIFEPAHGEDMSTAPPPAQRTHSILLTSNTQEWQKMEGYTLQQMPKVDHSSSAYSVVISPACFSSKQRRSLRHAFRTVMRLRFRKPKIPISRWAVQVMLFFISSMLNNAAFGYNVPMSVHIIFRSGGLVVNMVLGWLIGGRRYNVVQVFSVLLVTAGVACTTLSASTLSEDKVASTSSARSYLIGIVILTLALVISGFMGLSQDKVYAQYGRGEWEESMFYLHFLALPGFSLAWRDIDRQIRAINSSVRVEVGLETIIVSLGKLMQVENLIVSWRDVPILRHIWKRRVMIPSFYIALAVNVMTQLICVSGVNRLTSRVSSLTVTLVLVVRKAVSLGISAVVLERGQGGGLLLWTGAGLVLVGTFGYTMGTSGKRKESVGMMRSGDQGSIAKKEQ